MHFCVFGQRLMADSAFVEVKTSMDAWIVLPGGQIIRIAVRRKALVGKKPAKYR